MVGRCKTARKVIIKCMCIKKCWNHVYIYICIHSLFSRHLMTPKEKLVTHTIHKHHFEHPRINLPSINTIECQCPPPDEPHARAINEMQGYDISPLKDHQQYLRRGVSRGVTVWKSLVMSTTSTFYQTDTSCTLTSFEWNKKWIKSAPTSWTIAKKLL